VIPREESHSSGKGGELKSVVEQGKEGGNYSAAKNRPRVWKVIIVLVLEGRGTRNSKVGGDKKRGVSQQDKGKKKKGGIKLA